MIMILHKQPRYFMLGYISEKCLIFYTFCSHILGNCIINGFYILNYAYAGQNTQNIKKQIADFKYKEEAVTIEFGAGFTETFSYKEWKSKCIDFLNHFYTSDGEVTEVIAVPDATGEIYEKSLTNLPINILKTLTMWCSFSSNRLGLVVTNYNIKGHLNLLGVTENIFAKIGCMTKHSKDHERLIVFNAAEKVIFNIRVASDNLKEKIKHCVDDVNLLSLLLKEELRESGVVVAGLVTYHGISRHCTDRCDDCKHFIVPPAIFDSDEVFHKFWKNCEAIYLKERKPTKATEGNKCHVFLTISSKILGYMARFENSILPKLQDDPTKNIKETEILLSRYQMDIAYSEENHIVLRGDYGSGKTVIALKKMKMLLEKIKDNEVIYFINFSNRSQLHSLIKEKLKVLNGINEKLNVESGGYNLSYMIKSIILPREHEKGTKNIHLFVDEYAPENLTTKEASLLVEIFTKVEEFKQSTVLIAAQPIEITRTDYYYIDNEEKQYSEEGSRFDILKKSMVVYDLKYVMRTTVQINKLVQMTRDYLDNNSNHYTRLREMDDPSSNLNKKKASKFKTKASKICKRLFKGVRRTYKPPILISETTPFSFPDFSKSHRTIDHDEIYKLTFSRNNQTSENKQKIVTTYHFPCKSIIGHGISGPLPKIIKLPPSTSECEQYSLVAIFLKTIEMIESKRMAVIHFESSDSNFLKFLFQLPDIFPSLSVTDNVEKFFKNSTDSSILVANYNFVKGLEFSNVLLILDSDEYHLRQFVPEAMVRCQRSLSVLIISSRYRNDQKETVSNLVKYWVDVNVEEEETIIDNIQMQFCSKSWCNKKRYHALEYCQKNVACGQCDSVTRYNVHKNCKLYKNLFDKIQVNLSVSMESDEKCQKEEAITM